MNEKEVVKISFFAEVSHYNSEGHAIIHDPKTVAGHHEIPKEYIERTKNEIESNFHRN